MSTPQTQTASTKAADKKATPPPAADAKPTTASTAQKVDATPAPAPAASPATPAADGAPATDAAATDDKPKKRQKVYVAVGEIREFKNLGEAERFLNKDPEAPKSDYAVIKGKKVERTAKVSLR